MTIAPVIEAETLCKEYREGWVWRKRMEVLRGLTFDVRPGEVFGLLGPNGAGKTTFIKILLGIVKKTSGSARLLGYSAGDRRGRRLVGYLPEHLRVARHHTAYTALDYYGRLSGLSGKQIRARRDELLTTVGLAHRAKDCVAKYSKGMLQRLGLAQALLHDPQLVMLDEPTDGLDPVGRSHVRDIMLQLKQQGKTVFVNSHILQEMELVCDRVAILDKGSVRFVGPVKEITHNVSSSALGVAAGSQDTGELTLELAGPEANIRAALGDFVVSNWQVTPGSNLVRVMLQSVSQLGVDLCIDRLRQQGVSILNLSRGRRSLEDAFLAIVAEPVE